MADLLDQQLGNYRIMRLVGQGGFADVYLGEHMLLGTLAALKVHHARMDGADLERFEQEARTIARLNHPHIVRVLDYGVQDGVAYLVMNYAPHGTLRQSHPAGTVVALETIVQYVKQIAGALQYAHDQQLVHRDVKPENMLLDADHQVLLSDFGIAIHARSTASLGTQDAIGTVSYMAPEQLRKKARPASDQYALATIAYEWLTGAPPFDGLPIEVALQHITDAIPPLSEKRPDLSPGVERVLLRALAKEPEQRFPTIWSFAEALEQAAQGQGREKLPAQVSPLRQKRRRASEEQPTMAGTGVSRRAVLALGLVGSGILALGIGGIVWARTRVSPRVSVVSNPTIVSTPAIAPSPTASPTRAPASSNTTPSPRRGTFIGIQSVVWSPGGNVYAAADANGHLEVWQQPDQLQWQSTFSRIWSLAWSPDNGQAPRLALACDDGHVRIVDALSGKQVLLYTGHGAAGVLSVAWAASQYAPEYIVSGDNNGVIHVWNPNDGTTRFTVSQAAPVTGLAANYQFIAAGTQPGGIYTIWDSRTGEAMFQFHNDNQGDSDTPYMSINQQLTPGTLTAVGWSSDGQFAAVGDANGNVHFLSDISCSCFLHMSAFQAHKAQINAISWSSIGRQFATASNDSTVQTWSVDLGNQSQSWTDVRGRHLQTYTNANGKRVQTVAWSPDGKQLLYGDSSGNVGLWHV